MYALLLPMSRVHQLAISETSKSPGLSLLPKTHIWSPDGTPFQAFRRETPGMGTGLLLSTQSIVKTIDCLPPVSTRPRLTLCCGRMSLVPRCSWLTSACSFFWCVTQNAWLHPIPANPYGATVKLDASAIVIILWSHRWQNRWNQFVWSSTRMHPGKSLG